MHRETSKGKAWREGQCLALFNLSPVLTRTALVDLLANWGYRVSLVWAARRVQRELYLGSLPKKREKDAKGKKKFFKYGNSFMLSNEIAGEQEVFSAIVSPTWVALEGEL